jgi:hypothetical protein
MPAPLLARRAEDARTTRRFGDGGSEVGPGHRQRETAGRPVRHHAIADRRYAQRPGRTGRAPGVRSRRGYRLAPALRTRLAPAGKPSAPIASAGLREGGLRPRECTHAPSRAFVGQPLSPPTELTRPKGLTTTLSSGGRAEGRLTQEEPESRPPSAAADGAAATHSHESPAKQLPPLDTEDNILPYRSWG